MQTNLENSAVATELERSVFISIPRKAVPKKVQITTQLHSYHASKVMHKILQARLQQYVNQELPDVTVGF